MRNMVYKKAFGILEVMIASTIIIIVLSALTSVGRSTLRSSETIQERTQASYLAQEGIEIVRQMRDSNWIDGRSDTQWNSLVFAPSASPSPFEKIVNSQCYKIAYHEDFVTGAKDLNRFGLVKAPTCLTVEKEEIILDNAITYTRYVQIDGVGAALLPGNLPGDQAKLQPNSMKITVVVGWGDKTIEVSEMMTNWRPDY